MIRSSLRRLAALLVLVLLVPAAALAQRPTTEYQGAVALGLELRRLATTKRVLMVGAHPDDESTQILSTLALGQGADVAYLALTRGEGGQNGIGPELQEGLGLIRTEELLAARRLDGARQYFTRAYDFGFSKNAEEAFQHWPREEILGDVVAAVRHFRPDVILSIFSGTPRDGHGHHQAAGILAGEAFDAAGDPARYPEQLTAGLRPHAPAKLFRALWGQNEAADFRLDTGEFDPLIGDSYFQVAMASRSRHRSQDMGRPLTAGPQASSLELSASRPGIAHPQRSLFAGLDTTLSGHALALGDDEEGSPATASISLLREYERRVDTIRSDYNPLAPERLVGDLAGAVAVLREALAPLPEGELRQVGTNELAEIEAALWRAASLEVDAVADDESVVPGQDLSLTVNLWNGGDAAVEVRRLEPALPSGWTASASDPLPGRLAPGQLLERRFTISVPGDAEPSRPYFLRQARQGDLYAWNSGDRHVGVPFDPARLQVVAEVEIAGQPVSSTGEASFREVDLRLGEIRRPVRVVPAISLMLSPAAAVIPLDGSRGARSPLRVAVRVRSEAPQGVSGTLSLHAPDEWAVEPASQRLQFVTPGEERTVEFTVQPPSNPASGETLLRAGFVTTNGGEYDEGFALIDYPHIRPQPLFRDASVAVRAFPVAVPAGLTVGYIPGAGDDAPEALAQLGLEVTTIAGEELATGDLSRYDAVLTGIRAYEVNADLIAYNRRLLEYARRGGTVVVQYNKYEYTEPGVAPFPVAMSRPHDRVTDETAEVRLLDPSHPALSWPNRISGSDFEGWQQERGLYFLSEWDDRFTPLLEMADPGEDPLRGALLVAPLGEGVYVYSGLAFFRQLPEGVPGAYRLLVNLLSLGKTP